MASAGVFRSFAPGSKHAFISRVSQLVTSEWSWMGMAIALRKVISRESMLEFRGWGNLFCIDGIGRDVIF